MKELPDVVDHEDQQEFASPSPQIMVVDHEDQQEFALPSQQPSPQLPEQEENQGRRLVKAPGLSFFKTVERVLNVIILVILLTIVALIVLAEISSTANIQIERLLHIDIRSEVAYLIAAIRRLHW
jgi:hypothetical protein